MGRMRRTPLLSGSLLAALAIVTSACARATNYTDPRGPLYLTRHGGTPDASDRLRVVTFNIEHAREIDRAIEVLSETRRLRDADLVVLQEMDAPGTERIARALGMSSIYLPSTVHPRDGRDFGNAVLSRWPIEDGRKLLLPHASRIIGVRRAATVATVRVGGRRVRVYSVHLETMLRLGRHAREEQARTILADARTWGDPVIVAGDLNDRRLARLFTAAGFEWLTRDVHDTAGPFDFDHVFVRGLRPASSSPAGTEPARGASDHRPVWALMQLG